MSKVPDDVYVSRLMEFLEQERMRLGVPGIGVAIVRGNTSFSAGLGMLEINGHQPVIEDSLFGVASCSKNFTTTVCALLVEKGILDWDIPVQHYWPDFAFGNERLSAEVTLRDLCANRTGISRASAVEYGSILSFKEVVEGGGGLPSVAGFRDRYTYSNLHFTIAAALCEHVTGREFADILYQDVLVPLGMTSSSTQVTGLEHRVDFAKPHVRQADTYSRIPLVNLKNLVGAGSVTLTPSDAVKWLRFHLGMHENEESVLSHTARNELYRFQTRTRQQDGFMGYALGWRIGPDNDLRVIEHTGAINGVYSILRMIPSLDTGVFLSVNAAGVEIEDLRTVAADLSVVLADCDVNDMDMYISEAHAHLEQLSRTYNRSPWSEACIAPETSLLPGKYEGGPMGPLLIEKDNGSLIMSLSLLPTYRSQLIVSSKKDEFLLRTLEEENSWCRTNESIPVLQVEEGGNRLIWKHMWFGDCVFTRAQ